MLALFKFPHRYSATGQPAVGSIDEVSWIAADASGTGADRVPRGAALYVRGWILDPTGAKPAAAAIVTIDGSRTHQARVGLSRPDVAESLNNEALAPSGFEALIPTGSLEAGMHRIDVSAVDATSLTYASLSSGASFWIEVSGGALPSGVHYDDTPCAVTVDEMVDESRGEQIGLAGGRISIPRGSMLYVRGWGYDERSQEPLGELYAVVDGNRAHSTSYGTRREDVADAKHNTSLANVGFDVRIPTADLERGPHRLELVGLDQSGEALLRSGVSFELIVGEPMRSRFALSEQTAAYIDDVVRVRQDREGRGVTPLRVQRGDRVFVHGWAIDETANALAAGVVLLLDDDVEIQALYGLPRPDVAERFGAPALARCGFTAEIETAELGVGMHGVRCRVIASNGRGTLQTAQRFDFEVSELS